MANYLTVKINSAIVLPDKQELYLYIIGGITSGNTTDYYSYSLSTDGNYVATKGSANTVTAIPFSTLGVDPDNASVYYFNLDQSVYFSGRIWFSNSQSLLTISDLAVSQPEPSSGMLFDFAELTLTANDNVNLDTTQVVGIGIPITIVNPAAVLFPPQTPYSNYTYPNAIGIVPGNTLADLQTNFQTYLSEVNLTDFNCCVQSYTAPGSSTAVNWLINPGYMVNNYTSGTAPSGLSAGMDNVLFDFFNYYCSANGNNNTLSIVFEGITYTGATVIQAGIDQGNASQQYCALIFTDTSGNTYPIFYPYFSTNSASTQGGSLNPGGSLPPAPSWWSTKGLASTLPATGMVLQNEGVFKDQNIYVSNQTILAALQNIVVTMLNRGLIPGSTCNNLFACTGNLVLTVAPVSFTDKSPMSSASMNGASLVYSPSQIPPGGITDCTVDSATLVLNSTETTGKVTQSVKNNVVDSAPASASNYCTSPVLVQLASQNGQQVTNLVFGYESANWGSNAADSPQLTGDVKVTYVPVVQTAMEATFTGTGFPSGITTGMNVFDLNVQNPATVIATGTDSVTIQSTIGGLLPSPNTDTLVFGNFYPLDTNGQAIGYWNAFAGYLHSGNASVTAPYISNQGYAFAYDDDGGYSSDITLTFSGNNNVAVGIYLGALS